MTAVTDLKNLRVRNAQLTSTGPLHFATRYREKGWIPIPIPFREKGPRIQGWQKLRPSLPELPKLFDRKDLNVGVLLGEPSAWLVDVDLDAPEAVKLADYFLEPTVTFGRPGKLRSHRLYRSLQAQTVRFQAADGTMLLELRSNGAQTVFPGSVHPSGEKISFDRNETKLREIDNQSLKQKLSELAAASQLTRVWPKQPGTRHEIALALAGGLLRNGWSEEKVQKFIQQLATVAGDEESTQRARSAHSTARAMLADGRTTGWPVLARLLGKPVVERVVSWLGSRGIEIHEVSWEAPISFSDTRLPHFPIHIFPSPFREFVEAEALATQTPTDLAGILVLATAALACSKRAIVKVNDQWKEPLNLYCIVALESGERKSPVFEHVIAPLQEFERDEGEKLRPEIIKSRTQKEIRLKALAQAQKKAACAKKLEDRENAEAIAIKLAQEIEDLPIIREPQFVVQDFTPEKLSILLSEQGGKIGVLNDEGGVFEIIAGLYSQNGDPNLDLFLKGYSGTEFRQARVNRSAIQIDRPAITFGLAVQPDVIRDLYSKPGFRGRGLLARFLYVNAVSRSLVGRRASSAPCVSPALAEHYRLRMKQLLHLQLNEVGEPHFLDLSDEAREELRRFQDWLEPQLSPFGELVSIKDWTLKLPGQVSRIAGILHLLEHTSDQTIKERGISDGTMAQAVAIGNYLIPHARSAFALMGADPNIEKAEYVLAWIKRKDLRHFSSRDVFEGTKGRIPTVKELTPILELLKEYQWIRLSRVEKKGGPGRRPADVFDVNPALYSQNSHNSQWEEGR